MTVSARADLRHVDAWLFDIDDTLYPHDNGLMADSASVLPIFWCD